MVWGVLQFPGSCDERDALNACRLAGGEARLIWHGDEDLGGVDAVVVPAVVDWAAPPDASRIQTGRVRVSVRP